MARSCGLRIGPRRFAFLVLDGSPKKSRIVVWATGELPRAPSEAAGVDADLGPQASEVIRKTLQQHSIPTDNVGLAIDTGMGAFRTLKMPFSDSTKIEQVVKFEVESLLPQWSIDEVVVDFHVLETTGDSSELLITAVQKADLRRILDVCAGAGIEAQEAELEATALVNAAIAAEVCKVDTAQILVHIGEVSTSVVIMDAGKVREMRAIHLGALSHELPVAPTPGEAEPSAEASESEPVTAASAADPAERERRMDQAIRRIRREIGRTVSAARTVHPIEAIYVCGLHVPGLVGSQVFDVPIRALDVFGPQGGPSEGEAGELVVAYGAALRQLGGGLLRPSLRREELRYTGAFERLELPLAVVCLLLVTLLGVWNIFLYKEKSFVDLKLDVWREQTADFLLGGKAGRPAVLRNLSPEAKRSLESLKTDKTRPKYEHLESARKLLQDAVKQLEKDLGQDAEITQPQSALTALTLVLDVLEKQGTEIARPSLRKVTSVYQRGRSGKADNVKITFDVTFFAETPALATNYYETFIRELKSKPWFVTNDERQNQALDDGKGITLAGIGVTVDVTKAPAPEVAAQ